MEQWMAMADRGAPVRSRRAGPEGGRISARADIRRCGERKGVVFARKAGRLLRGALDTRGNLIKLKARFMAKRQSGVGL